VYFWGFRDILTQTLVLCYNKNMQKLCPTEDKEQVDLALWLDQQQLWWFHVPNEGLKSINYHVKMKARGLKSGVLDNWIITPAPKFPSARGVVVELKRRQGGKTSKEQKEWVGYLTSIGWIAKVCNGATEAIDFLKTLGYGVRPITEIRGYEYDNDKKKPKFKPS
jgi:hypothetical protein